MLGKIFGGKTGNSSDAGESGKFSVSREALLNPFIQAAVVFTLTGMGMVRKPSGAWIIALAGVTFFSIASPIILSLNRQWFRRLFMTNMAVIAFWAATLLLARLLAPHPETSPSFLLGGMAYVYSIALSAILRLLLPIIASIIYGRSASKPQNGLKNQSGSRA